MEVAKKSKEASRKTTAELSSAVLRRLVAEVSDGSVAETSAYNRTYNRHNR